jgi:hypothetical protein
MDPQEWLTRTVKDSAEVNPVYGGYELRVLKPEIFPWYVVLNFLIEMGQEVWVDKKEDTIFINSEPKTE